MKKIWIVSTGGTIGSAPGEDARALHRKSAESARRYLINQLEQSKSAYARYADLLQDAAFPWEDTTLSESMTLDYWNKIVVFLAGLDKSDCAGVILLHGTDSLAYTAALLSMLCNDWDVPLFLVSGNRPPIDPMTNAHANFTAAVELIWEGIAPNVYVTYRNRDGVTRLYLGSQLMQSENFSEDFRACEESNCFDLSADRAPILAQCEEISKKRSVVASADARHFGAQPCHPLLLFPYPGLDYSIYDGLLAQGQIGGIVHGSYHSGTVCYPGLVIAAESRNCQKEAQRLQAEGKAEEAAQAEEMARQLDRRARALGQSVQSVGYLAKQCEAQGIPLLIAPSKLGKDQYETMQVVCGQTNSVLLHMTTECAYAKLCIGLSCGLSGQALFAYLTQEINSEFAN